MKQQGKKRWEPRRRNKCHSKKEEAIQRNKRKGEGTKNGPIPSSRRKVQESPSAKEKPVGAGTLIRSKDMQK